MRITAFGVIKCVSPASLSKERGEDETGARGRLTEDRDSNSDECRKENQGAVTARATLEAVLTKRCL